MISLTLNGGGAFYVTPDSIEYVRELTPVEHEQYPPATCAIGIGGKEFFVRGLAQNVAAEIQDENKTTRVEAQPHFELVDEAADGLGAGRMAGQ
jgi:tartrate dehydratase alpha subunit/fumarate hydratase class I-like protein